MTFSVFGAMENIIARRHDTKQKFYRWTLPRQTGATNWIINRIRKDIDGGLIVAVTGRNAFREFVLSEPQMRQYQSERTLYVFSEGRSETLSGLRIDRIYVDNPQYWNPNDLTELYHKASAVLTKDGYLIALDTTEGQ